MASKTSTLLAQWLGQPGGLPKVVSSSPNPSNFLFDAHKDLYLYIQCMYIVCTLYKLVCTWYRHVHHFECLHMVHLGASWLTSVCTLSVNYLYSIICMYMFVDCMYIEHTCLYMVQTCFTGQGQLKTML